MYIRAIKAPVIVTVMNVVAAVPPFLVWEGSCPIDMVCVTSSAAGLLVLFGDSSMNTVTATTGFPVTQEPIVFTLGPTTRYMSVTTTGTPTNMSYYFVGQTDASV